MPPPTPSTAPGRMVVGALSQGTCVFVHVRARAHAHTHTHRPRAAKSDQKPILFFDRFLISFWIDFWIHLGAILNPFEHQKPSKFYQNVISNLIWVKNVNVHETL